MAPPLAALTRGAQKWLLNVVRRSPFFPRTVPDRVGDDDAMAGRSLAEPVLVYFPGAPDSLYQITPWLGTFEALHREHPLLIVCQDSRVARAIRARATVHVVTIARYGRLDDLLARSEVKLALYVSHSPRNFECLRFASLLHVYIGHGDSDKGVSASNQLKAYDYVLTPGQAAVDRIRVRLMNFDADERCIVVGQPQWEAAAAAHATAAVPPVSGARRTVLYAPTWEGAQPSVAYSSIVSHGVSLVDALLADDRFSVEYRPHPLSGVTSAVYAGAHRAIVERVARAARGDSQAGHAVIDTERESLDASFARADILVCDVSAVAIEWLPTLKPIVVTEPATDEAVSAKSPLLDVVRRMTRVEATEAGEMLWAELAGDPSLRERRELARYYLGYRDSARARFIEVCGDLMRLRDRERARVLESGGSGT